MSDDAIDCTLDGRAVLQAAGVRASKVTDADLAKAERLWWETGHDEPFADQPKNVREWAAVLSRLVDVNAPEETYRCRTCLDEGYTRHTPETIVSQITGKRLKARGATIARFCEACDAGMAVESGYWADHLKPRRGERTNLDAVKARYQERLRMHANGITLRDRVDRLLKRKDVEEAS